MKVTSEIHGQKRPRTRLHATEFCESLRVLWFATWLRTCSLVSAMILIVFISLPLSSLARGPWFDLHGNANHALLMLSPSTLLRHLRHLLFHPHSELRVCTSTLHRFSKNFTLGDARVHARTNARATCGCFQLHSQGICDPRVSVKAVPLLFLRRSTSA